MELRQLEYFVAVAEEANFTRAARRVHISQSGVSAQIIRLERELGAQLIDRSGRTATLTAAGTAALEHARATLSSADAVRQAVDEVTGLLRGRLVVGMVTGCTIAPLFDALAAFSREHPGVEIGLAENTSDLLVAGVRGGDIDMALIGVAGSPPAGLESLTILSEPLIAAVAPDHRLARRTRAKLADVSAEPIVCLPEGTGIRTAFDVACRAQGIAPNIVLQAGAPDAVAGLAARGLGVAILSESMIAADDRHLRAVALHDVTTPALLALVWNPSHSAALRELVRHSRATFVPPRATK